MLVHGWWRMVTSRMGFGVLRLPTMRMVKNLGSHSRITVLLS